MSKKRGVSKKSKVSSRKKSKRKKAEEKLRESEEKYKTLTENIPDVIWVTDSEGKTTYISPNVKKVYGYTPEEIYKSGERLWFGRIHPEDVGRLKKEYSLMFKKGKPLDVEYRIKRKDGKWIWLHDKGIRTYKKGNVSYAEGIFSDVTERKGAEELLEETERRLKQFIDFNPDLIFLKDTNYRYLLVNKANAEFFGKDEKDILGKTDFDLMPKKVAQGCRKSDSEAVKKRKTVVSEESVGDKIYETRKIPVIKDGKVLGVIGIVRDITEQKKSEEGLHESEERFHNLIEYIPESIQGYRTDGTVFYWNKASEKVYGYTAEEAIGKNLGDLIIPDNIMPLFKKALRIAKKIKKSGEFAPPGEIMLLHKKGHLVPVFSIYTAVHVKGREPLLYCIDVDLSERGKVEETLKKYQQMVESAHDAIFFKDLKSRYIIANDKTLEAFGLPREKVIGKNDYELMPDRKEAKKNVVDDQLVFKTKELKEITKHMTGADGKEYWFQAIKVPQFDDKGNVIGLVGIARDITELKEAEMELRDTKERFRALANMLPQIVFEADEKGNLTFININALEAYGYSLEDFGKGLNILKLIVPEDRKKAMKGLRRILKGEGVGGTEYTALRKDGTNFYVAFYANPLVRKGKVIGMRGIVIDTTDRKKAEEKIKEAEQRFKGLFETSNDAIMTLDPPTWMFTSGNPATIEMFGAKDEKDFTSRGPWQYSPEKQPDGQLSKVKAKKMIMLAMKKGKNFFEWDHMRLNKEVFPATVLLSRMELAGKTFLQATVRDVSVEKKAERELKKAYEYLKKKTEELERFQRVAVGREIKMVELKKQIENLKR